MLGQVGDLPAPRPQIEVAQIHVADGDRPAARGGEPEEQGGRGRLPRAVRADHDDGLARGDGEVGVVEDRFGPARDLVAHGAQRDRHPRRVRDRRDRCRDGRSRGCPGRPSRANERQRLGDRGEPLGALVELGARPAQRQEDLGRDDQHGERRRELDRPVQQPQPEGDREEGDGDRRQRVEHERREEGDAQRRQAGGPQRLAGPRDAGALLGGAAEGPQDGKALEDVGDVTAEVLDLVPAVAGERQARPSDERPEHREQADRRDDDETRDPVEHADGDREGERSHDREDEIRQAPPDVDVEGVEPASGHRREVSRTACVSEGGSGEGRGDESRSQVGLGRCRTVVGEGLAARARRGRGRRLRRPARRSR